MEKGFFHPSRGYWQTTGVPPEEILAAYPEGTVEVPLKPGADHEWDGAAWKQTAPRPDAELLAEWRASALVPKLALVRAMRLTPFGGGTAWDAVKAGLAAAAADTQEDWQIATYMPRADADLNAMATALAGKQADAMLDALFTLADQIDKGAVPARGIRP